MSAINVNVFKNMLIGGASNLKNHSNEINDLNVFPVPDGDTGLNMCKTIDGGVAKIINKDFTSVSELMNEFVHGTLLSARGNSGVILSQIFKGVSVGLQGLSEVSVVQLVHALEEGVKFAYSAVERPIEGTILTVFREATEYEVKIITDDTTVEEFFKLHIEQAAKTLARTKEILPQLKEAGVVDSGGAGYLRIVEGMYKALTGEEIVVTVDDYQEVEKELDYSAFTRDSIMTYGYCTELIIRLQTSKTDVDNFDVSVIREELKAIGGDSIVTYSDGDIVKVHVHTLTPGVALNVCQKYGEFLHLKIENMTLQHEETISTKVEEKKHIAVVTVANGDGLIDLFKQLGADGVVNGGQTGNPAAADFIEEFKKINAENIIVFPNNGNIILAAEQAAELYTDAKVTVVPTKTIQQGYCALSVVSDCEEFDALIEDIKAVISGVKSYEVTYAVRDAKLNGVEVKKDEFMCISDGKLISAGIGRVNVLIDALRKTDDIDEKELLTVFYGKKLAMNEKNRFRDAVEELFPDLELIEYEGGQDIYSFLVCLE
ncbi:MAG: DAK2 domain-containing protein [Clostridia bacterium]|nr:DAK2 domain-containing protein [Clostridia bacterium]